MSTLSKWFLLISLPGSVSLPANGEEWRGTAISANGSEPVEIVIDKNGGGTLSVGTEHFVLKLNGPAAPAPISTPSANVGPEAAAYMAKIGALIKRHWRKSLNMPEKHVIVRFYIKPDGSIEDLKLDPTSDQKLDDYTVRAFDAVKQAAPFPAPPTSLLEENKVEIKFAFDINRRNQTFGFGRGLLFSP